MAAVRMEAGHAGAVHLTSAAGMRRILAAVHAVAARPMRRASLFRMRHARWRIVRHTISRRVMPRRVHSRERMLRRAPTSRHVPHGAIVSGSARRRISAQPRGLPTDPL